MTLTLSHLLSLARYTVQSPRDGARMVMQANLPMPFRWAALALMAVASSLMAHLSFGLMPAEMQAQMGGAMASPFRTAVLQAALMLGSVYAIHWIGRWRNGKGSFEDALILMVWLQFILLILQVVQIAVQLVMPPLSDLIGILSVAVFLWLLSNFIAELHGFSSVGMTFLGVLATLLALGFGLAILMVPFMGAGV